MMDAKRPSAILGMAVSCVLTCIVMLLACVSARATVSLPDGRSFEMVTPLEKNGGEINGIDGAVPNNGLPEGGIVQAASDGDSVTYVSLLAFPGSAGTQPMGAPIAGASISQGETLMAGQPRI